MLDRQLLAIAISAAMAAPAAAQQLPPPPLTPGTAASRATDRLAHFEAAIAARLRAGPRAAEPAVPPVTEVEREAAAAAASSQGAAIAVLNAKGSDERPGPIFDTEFRAQAREEFERLERLMMVIDESFERAAGRSSQPCKRPPDLIPAPSPSTQTGCDQVEAVRCDSPEPECRLDAPFKTILTPPPPPGAPTAAGRNK